MIAKRCPRLLYPGDHAVVFVQPLDRPGLSASCRMRTTPVTMPEAAVNKYNSFIFRQNDIRRAGEVFTVQSEPVAHTMEKRSDDPGFVLPDRILPMFQLLCSGVILSIFPDPIRCFALF